MQTLNKLTKRITGNLPIRFDFNRYQSPGNNNCS